MKAKIFAIFILMLLIVTVIPAVGMIKEIKKEDMQPLDTDWWSMWRHDPGNCGSTTSEAPNTNQISWQKNIGDQIYSGVPIIVDNKLFISTNWYYFDGPPGPPSLETLTIPDAKIKDESINPSEIFENLFAGLKEYSGGVYCMDANTGAQLWNYPLDIANDPAVVDGKVYVTETDYYNSLLYCLDANTGSYIWSKPISGGWIFSSTIVADDKIFLGSMDIDYYNFSGKFQCFDLNGNMEWTYPLLPNEIMFLTNPAVSNGKVYFTTVDLYSYYYGNLYCLDAETGELIWLKPVSTFWLWYYGTNSPICAENNVYVLDIDPYSYYGYLRCYNGDTGSTVWNYPLGLAFSTPAYYDGSIFITDFDFHTYNSRILRINAATGSLVWMAYLPGSYYFLLGGSPVVADDLIYIIPSIYFYYYSQDLYCLDANNGDIIWYYSLDYPTGSSPSIALGRVYIADMSGNVYAFGVKNEIPTAPTITGPPNGKPGKSYSYSFTSFDADGDDIYYFIYWDDGTEEPWNGPHPSGTPLTLSHTWDEKGIYNITAKAKDSLGYESDWTVFQVKMPKNKIKTDLYLLLFDKLINHLPILSRILNNL